MESMITPTQSALTLRDGRALAYVESGDPGGTPVLFCHGWMASRLVRHPDDELTRSLGVRLITADRPGVGGSDHSADGSFTGVAGDLGELVDQLGIDTFAVLGHSGGGPFALALAHRMGARVTAAAVASGFAPFDRPDPYQGMTPRMRGFVRLLRRAPWLAGPFLRSAPRRFRQDPEKAFAKQFGPLCEADEQALADPATRAIVLAAAVEAVAGGSAGVAGEAKWFFTRPWGFSPAEIGCGVDLWYGDADTIVPPDMGRHLASVIPHSRLSVLPGEGHMVFIAHWAEILRRLTPSAGV
jgi:pimeloyl-ACP methyl ester carboxylesterase